MNIKIKLDESTGLSLEGLNEWARGGDPLRRIDVASNENTPTDTLTMLASDPELWVRQAVLYNPNTPPLVKMWLQGGYSEMSLKDFLDAALDEAKKIAV